MSIIRKEAVGADDQQKHFHQEMAFIHSPNVVERGQKWAPM